MKVEQFRRATLYLGDCREILPELTGGVSAIVTDPPYGIAYQTGRRKIMDTPDILKMTQRHRYGACRSYTKNWKTAVRFTSALALT